MVYFLNNSKNNKIGKEGISLMLTLIGGIYSRVKAEWRHRTRGE